MAPPPQTNGQKRGLGCCGCGCLVLLLLVLLGGGLLVYGVHAAYQISLSLTDQKAEALPVLDGGDDVYRAAEQKVSDFQRGVQLHRAAQLNLSAVELNTLIAHNNDLRGRVLVEINNGVARVRSSASLAALPFFAKYGLFPGRYLNTDQSFTLGFDLGSHQVHVDLRALRWGQHSLSKADLEKVQPYVDPMINQQIQAQLALKSFIDQVITLKLQDDRLIIETQESGP